MALKNSVHTDPVDRLAPVRGAADEPERRWSRRLVLFLSVMAGISMCKGLYHWSLVCGFGTSPGEGFESHELAWQTATIFFAVIDLVAAVGLWLAAPWGVVVWLAASVSMVAVEVFFPQVYGGQFATVVAEFLLIGGYLYLAVKSAREQQQ
jgi:fatty acid desaturase